MSVLHQWRGCFNVRDLKRHTQYRLRRVTRETLKDGTLVVTTWWPWNGAKRVVVIPASKATL